MLGTVYSWTRHFIFICASHQSGMHGSPDSSPPAPQHPRLPQPVLREAAGSSAARGVSTPHSYSSSCLQEQQRPPTHSDTQTLKRWVSLSPFPCGAAPRTVLPASALTGPCSASPPRCFCRAKRAARSKAGTQAHPDQQRTAHTRAV